MNAKIIQTDNVITINFGCVEDAVNAIELFTARANGVELPKEWLKLSEAAPLLNRTHNSLVKHIHRTEELRRAKKLTEWKFGKEYRKSGGVWEVNCKSIASKVGSP
jgi:hypothetical protein